MTKLTEDIIVKLAREFQLDTTCVKAVIKVESSGSGFSKDTSKIVIQFEPYHFQMRTGVRIANGVENQTKEWLAFNEAFKLHPTEAMESTSWGLGQVMGFNHEAAGYKTVDAMLDDFKLGEEQQLRGMLNFIKSNKTMYNALKTKKWDVFASCYNGKYYKKFNYDTRLQAAYETVN